MTDIVAQSSSAEIPVSWLIGTLASLGGLVSYLARTIYCHLTTQITVLTKEVIVLRNDVLTLSKGCGINTCYWRNAAKIQLSPHADHES